MDLPFYLPLAAGKQERIFDRLPVPIQPLDELDEFGNATRLRFVSPRG